ncbi:unnamed protein product, partial [Iphiclides podalirius]
MRVLDLRGGTKPPGPPQTVLSDERPRNREHMLAECTAAQERWQLASAELHAAMIGRYAMTIHSFVNGAWRTALRMCSELLRFRRPPYDS